MQQGEDILWISLSLPISLFADRITMPSKVDTCDASRNTREGYAHMERMLQLHSNDVACIPSHEMMT